MRNDKYTRSNQSMSNNPPRENKMGTMPIGKLLINMALPMIISMLVQALYNVVDSSVIPLSILFF